MDPAPDRRPETGRPTPSSAEYRQKLLTKLNCLIAVLEVAIAKIQRSMDLPGANEELLGKIRANLENTLAICTRAKHTLEKALAAADGNAQSAKLPDVDSGRRRMTYRDYVELSSISEYRKFKAMAPITRSEIQATDIDELV